MSYKYMIQPERWHGWIETPAPATGFASSPILVTDLVPLKTGKGLLRLQFVQPLRPRHAERRSVTLRVLQHRADHLVATFDDAGVLRTVIVSMADYRWIESYCQELARRRPPQGCTTLIDGEPLWETTPEQHLQAVFGATEAEVLAGATAGSFGARLHPMPLRASSFALNVTCPPFDSLLIARGVVPKQMEDKWFVVLDEGHLLFYRSWTGFLVYEVEAVWRGDQLYLGAVRVNRDPEQYSETDDAYDKALLQYLFDVLLRGVPGSFPIKDDDDGLAPIKAWSVAGKASLT